MLVRRVLIVALILTVWLTVQVANAGVLADREGRLDRSGLPQDAALSLPDLQTLPPYDLRLILNQNAGRMWIRFSNSILNDGPGTLELAGKRDPQSEAILVHQNIYYADDRFVENPLGLFEFEASHSHWHYESFSLYQVWRVGADGQPLDVVASSGKVSYCVRDSDPIEELDDSRKAPLEAPDKPGYLACGWSLQGLSPGWVDTYLANTPGQFVDISGLPQGDYMLVSTVDPDNLLIETNEDNNSAFLYFTLGEEKVVIADGQMQIPRLEGELIYSVCQPDVLRQKQIMPDSKNWRSLLSVPCFY